VLCRFNVSDTRSIEIASSRPQSSQILQNYDLEFLTPRTCRNIDPMIGTTWFDIILLPHGGTAYTRPKQAIEYIGDHQACRARPGDVAGDIPKWVAKDWTGYCTTA